MLNPDHHRGVIPEAGVYSVKWWAVFFDASEDTIRRWIKEYGIPFYQPGTRMFVAATDFLKAIPYHNSRDPPAAM